MSKNYYLILGVGRGADREEIKRAYRAGVKACHPDTSEESRDPQRFRDLQEAYETLSDRERRGRYDRRLDTPPSPEYDAREVPVRRGRPGRTPSGPSEVHGTSGAGQGPVEEIRFEVVLRPEEARRGAAAPIHIPVTSACPACGASRGPLVFCPVCGGRGRVRGRRDVTLQIPPGVAHGTAAAISLASVGLPRVRLRVTILVEPHALRRRSHTLRRLF